MKKVCEEYIQQFKSAGSPADYDTAFEWGRTNARAQIDLVDEAFKNWREVRETEAAQDYLLSLFLPRQPKSG